jgi:hypothetical protein
VEGRWELVEEVHKIDMLWRNNQRVDIRAGIVDAQGEAAKKAYPSSSIVNGRSRQTLGLADAADELYNDVMEVGEDFVSGWG